jgi:hypothetical protein
VRGILGLAENEVVVALVHLGTRVTEPPAKERSPVNEIFSVQP